MVVKTFNAKDGQTVILRTPRWEDIDDLTELVNSLVDEEADIAADHEVPREQETELLAKQLVEVEKDNKFVLIAEVGGKIVANSSITRQAGYSKHVGRLFVAVRDRFRDIGIGTEIVKTLISQAANMGLKMVELYVFSTNERAIHLYEKVGFRVTGKIPKEICRHDTFIDHIIMVKELCRTPTSL